MKKVLFSLLVAAISMVAASSAKAQSTPIKIGYFDLDQMVTLMPGYPRVDSLLQEYQADSLNAEYSFYNSEYARLDSTYKADSAARKSPTVLDMEKKQQQQVAVNLVYWNQISQNKLENKRQQLAQPLYEQVAGAYKKILDAKKYTLILKPAALEYGTAPSSAQGGADNIFDLVAKELKIPLGNNPAAADEPEAPAAKPQTTKPATGAKPKQ